MSEILDKLKAKYPHWDNIVSEPAADCGCKGTGERHTKFGLSVPCLCVCLSEMKGCNRADAVREVGNAARRVKP